MHATTQTETAAQTSTETSTETSTQTSTRTEARTEARTSRPRRGRVVRGHLGTALLVVFAVALLGAAAAVFSGAYQVRPVLSSSMTPELPVGAVVITQRVPVSSVRAGDVIVFHDPYTPAKLVVHRVTTLTRADGVTTVTTKGDANRVADPWTVTLRGSTSYRAVGAIPYVGRVAVWFHQPAIASHIVPVGLALGGLALVVLLWPARKSADAPQDDVSPRSPETGAGPDLDIRDLFEEGAGNAPRDEPVPGAPGVR